MEAVNVLFLRMTEHPFARRVFTMARRDILPGNHHLGRVLDAVQLDDFIQKRRAILFSQTSQHRQRAGGHCRAGLAHAAHRLRNRLLPLSSTLFSFPGEGLTAGGNIVRQPLKSFHFNQRHRLARPAAVA